MTTPLPIAVCGLGRCGTSLVMQMLYAAGVPCHGHWPAFEPETMMAGCDLPAIMPEIGARAFKLLDPHKRRIGTVPFAAIWLDRVPQEQARSQARFVNLLNGLPMPNHSELRRWTASLRGEARRARRALGNRPMIRVRFEELILEPFPAARRIADFLEPWWPGLDPEIMACQRDPQRISAKCSDTLETEVQLVTREPPEPVPHDLTEAAWIR